MSDELDLDRCSSPQGRRNSWLDRTAVAREGETLLADHLLPLPVSRPRKVMEFWRGNQGASGGNGEGRAVRKEQPILQ